MTRHRAGQRGMSLVEATIILLVLMILTGVLAPSINDFVNDAKDVKVKEDCEAIGVAVMRLTRDVGPCLRQLASDPCTKDNRADILVSDGKIALSNIDLATAPDATSPNINCLGFLNWDQATLCGDTMDRQFVTNAPGYGTPADVASHNPLPGYQVPGPAFYLGWRGAYLAPHIGPDPYGLPYVVNSVFLSAATDATTAGEGHRTRGWTHDAFCISAGRNNVFQTPFSGDYPTGQKGTVRKGDDFVYVMSGSTR